LLKYVGYGPRTYRGFGRTQFAPVSLVFMTVCRGSYQLPVFKIQIKGTEISVAPEWYSAKQNKPSSSCEANGVPFNYSLLFHIKNFAGQFSHFGVSGVDIFFCNFLCLFFFPAGNIIHSGIKYHLFQGVSKSAVCSFFIPVKCLCLVNLCACMHRSSISLLRWFIS